MTPARRCTPERRRSAAALLTVVGVGVLASLGACHRTPLRLGDGEDAAQDAPAPIEPDQPPLVVRALATGTDATCALLADGSVACWGSDVHGQLAIDYSIRLAQQCGGRYCATQPEPTDYVGQRVEIDAGDGFVCARSSAGTVSCWGSHRYGELGHVLPADHERHFEPVDVALPEPAVDVAVGRHHACARDARGLVRCWGLGAHGQLGRDTAERCDVPEGAAAQLGVPPSAATVACSATPALVEGLGPVDRVEAGDFHTCAIRAGTVLCWGRDDRGQLGDGELGAPRTAPAPIAAIDPPLGSIDRLALGRATSIALQSTGRSAGWGDASHGALAFSPDEAAPCADGDVARCAPLPRVADSPLASVALGDRFGCGLSASGRALCWGLAAEGRLGRASLPAERCAGDGEPQPCAAVPGPVDALPEGVRAIAVGEAHACALVFPVGEDDASVRCWGRNDMGQLGIGTHGTAVMAPAPVDRTR